MLLTSNAPSVEMADFILSKYIILTTLSILIVLVSEVIYRCCFLNRRIFLIYQKPICNFTWITMVQKLYRQLNVRQRYDFLNLGSFEHFLPFLFCCLKMPKTLLKWCINIYFDYLQVLPRPKNYFYYKRTHKMLNINY